MVSTDVGEPLSKQEARTKASSRSSELIDSQDDDEEMGSCFTMESFFDSSMVSGCAIEETIAIEEEGARHDYEIALKDDSYPEENAASHEESIKSKSENRNRHNNRRRYVNRSRLQKTARPIRDAGEDMDDTIHTCHDSGMITEGDISFIIVEESDEEYEERTVEDFFGSSGDFTELEMTETEADIPEDDDIQDDAQSAGEFSLKLPTFSGHGYGNYDSVSTISFAFDDLGRSFSSELTDYDPIVFVTGGASAISRQSASTAQTPTSSSMMTEMQSTKPLSFTLRTQGTMASSIISTVPTAVAANGAMAPSGITTKELDRSNAIISNVTRNINSNRKKGGKHMPLSRNFLQPLSVVEGDSRSRSRSLGPINQRRRSRERRGGDKKSVPIRRKSLDDEDFDPSENDTFDEKQTDQTGQISSSLHNLKIGGPMRRVLRTKSSSKRIIRNHSGQVQKVELLQVLGESDRSIISHGWSQSSSSSPRLGRLQKVQLLGGSDQSIISQGFLSQSSSSDRLTKSNSSGRLSRSSNGCEPSRSNSSGRLSRGNSGSRLGSNPNDTGTARRMLSDAGSGKVLREDSNPMASGSYGGRVHVVPISVGSSNRRILARVNSAKKLVLDDQRRTGSHSRTGIFKIEEIKDSRSAKSTQ
ncbi:unnamed protein product [Cylindrotheca closterium]|uniref:Uncharacterized protein n=1 Tax=Cylindrotheca closterium TaxID=2856 RepID=A0AAD2G7J4_9STRA|nr:unnamed protein product [Cylindrotheca closterium]